MPFSLMFCMVTEGAFSLLCRVPHKGYLSVTRNGNRGYLCYDALIIVCAFLLHYIEIETTCVIVCINFS